MMCVQNCEVGAKFRTGPYYKQQDLQKYVTFVKVIYCRMQTKMVEAPLNTNIACGLVTINLNP